VAYKYAKDVIKGRFPLAEKLFFTSPKAINPAGTAVSYAENIIKGRWPEAEPHIAQDALTSLAYATRVIKGRFPPGEKVILDPKYVM